MGGSRNFLRGYHDNIHQHISQRVVQTCLEKQLDPRGPIASQGWSVPVFLRRGVWTPVLPPSGSTFDVSLLKHMQFSIFLIEHMTHTTAQIICNIIVHTLMHCGSSK